MAPQDRNPNGPAVEKRTKISKTQQQTLLIALITAVVVGVCGTLAVFFGKYIGFNKKVIVAKDSAISDYEATIKNVGLCTDKNRDGKFSLDEIKSCNPDALNSLSLTGTLRNNVLVTMAKNADLESVARNNQKDCYDANGEMIDWQEKFDTTTDDEEQSKYFAMLKMCSALRVVPDALPAQENEEALMSSLNQVFILSDWEPESISPSGNSSTGVDGLSIIPISLIVETKSDKTMTVLENIEKSIRTFDLKTANISWSTNNFLTIKAQGAAYYTEGADVIESTQTVYASDAAKKKSQTGGR
jgi:hypothetical protein